MSHHTNKAADSQTTAGMDSLHAFFATRSRVLLVHSNTELAVAPATMWEGDGQTWAVYGTHEEACRALTLGHNISTAQEKDLEPFHKLKQVRTHPAASRPTTMLHYTLSSNPPNPKTSFRFGDWICPQPKCAAHNFGRNVSCIGCGYPRSGNASLPQQQSPLQQHPSAARLVAPSPRFTSDAAAAMSTVYYSSAQPNHQQHLSVPNLSEDYARSRQHQQSQTQQAHLIGQPPPRPSASTPASNTAAAAVTSNPPPKPTHPILTPSGRAFAIGGKVQNVSSDPLSPCIMYWPDNEPFPEQGQIRPSNVVGVTQPPILNTGNRGPISHQPGDWICQKCNYLNWRRRKVCQTCLPYAEGNGDSISAAVQAERIALLTQVLSQTHLSTPNGGVGVGFPSSSHHANANAGSPSLPPNHPLLPNGISSRTNTLTPPQVRRNAATLNTTAASQAQYSGNTNLLQDMLHAKTLHHSHSHLSLNGSSAGNGVHYSSASPIYQTSGVQQRHRSPLPTSRPQQHHHQPQPQHQQQHQQQQYDHQQHREPSPLYSTGPTLNKQYHYPSHASSIDSNQHQGFNRVIGSNPAGNASRVSLNSNASASSSVASASAASTASSGSSSFVSGSSARSSPAYGNGMVGQGHGLNNGVFGHGGGLPGQRYGADVRAPAPLLPSFLQDIVQSPSLSPTSTTTLSSSADLSSGEDDFVGDFGRGVGGRMVGANATRFTRPRVSSGSTDSNASSGGGVPVGSIWKLDGEETKSLTGSGGGYAPSEVAVVQPPPRGVIPGMLRKASREMVYAAA